MTTGETIAAIAVFVIAGGLFLLGVRHFMEQGFLLNNAYIYASEKERNTMDKKPYYRQSGVVFCLLGLLFTAIGLSVVLRSGAFLWAEAAIAAGTAFYAAASSVRIGKERKKQG